MKKSCELSERQIKRLKNNSLKLSIREGSSSAIMSGTGTSFVTPYALALNASNFQIGFLSSFIWLVGPLAQLKSSHLMEHFSRKKIVVVSVLLQALMWIPVLILGLMFYFKIWLDYLLVLLIIFYSMQVAIGAIAGPAWFSWMGDLVPEKKRGRYFGKRNKITEGIAIFSMLVAGFALDFFKTKGLVLVGFTILFSVAMFARLYAVLVFTRHYHPDLKLKKGYYFSFKDFISHGLKTNFGKFVLFVAFMHLAVAIASPFFAVFMLRELEFSYKIFTIISISSGVFSIFSMKFWGRFVDRYGNHLVLKICSFFIPLVPLAWIFNQNPFYLIFVPSLISGIFWGGFNLAMFNFIYDSVKPEHRALCNAYTNILVGFGLFIGALIGGSIARFVSWEFLGSIFFTIFLISGILRAVVTFILIPQIKEVRYTKKSGLIIKELRYLDNIEHGVSSFRNTIYHESHLPKIDGVKKIGKIFAD